MKKVLLFFCFLSLTNAIFALPNNDIIYTELSNALNEKSKYTLLKEERIAELKKSNTCLSPLQQFELNNILYKEYRKFNLDSALCYTKRNLRLAKELNRVDLENAALLQLVPLYSSTGLYREAESILKSLKKKELDRTLLPEYYDAYSQLFSHYNANHNLNQYYKQSETYRDSLLAVLDSTSIRYRINVAEQRINLGQFNLAEKDLLTLFAIENEDTPNYAMLAYLLGNAYRMKHDDELAKKYFAISATADIKNAIKDNASLQHLAMIYYKSGDIDNAYKCTTSAIEDAIFCKIQFRKLSMSELYNIINTAYLDKENKQKDQLQIYLLLISILTIFLLLAIIYVNKQMTRLSKIKEDLFQTTQRLAELNKDISKTNEQLQERNAQLFESNHIKEEYIANFFDICSTYINKLEKYRITLNKKALAKQYDELFKILKSTTLVDTELEDLYKTFDTIFLSLYPTFVKDFNSLLIPEEQVILKQGELLSTELRIFALIRLGITDSVKIAAFLRYSLSSIYNYRTRARNKAAASRNEFEERVMKIGILPKKTN